MFDYAKSFLNAYKNEKKILILNMMDMHDGTGEVINYLDKPMAQFMREASQMESTALMMFSDHGFHLGGLKKTFGGVQDSSELFNPYIVTANLKGLTPLEQENFDRNQQKLMTH